jgi:hypothetical protein
MAAWTALQEALSMGELINNVIAATKGLKGMAAVQAVLNVIMDANPAGLIVTGIALLAAAAFLVIKNWKPISQFFVKLWTGITGAFSKAWGFISKLLDNPVIRTLALIFFPFITIPLLIIKNWKGITAFFVNLWGGITAAVKKGIGFINKILDNKIVQKMLAVFFPFISVPILIVKNWKRISGFFGNIWDGIKDSMKKGGEIIPKFLSGLQNGVKDTIDKITNTVANFFVCLGNGIGNAVKDAVGFIWKALDNPVLQKILAVFMPIVGLPVIIMKNWKGISEFFGKLFDDLLKVIPEPVKQFFNLDKVNVGSQCNTPSGNKLQASGPVLNNQSSVIQKKETMTQNQQITVKFDNMPKGAKIDTSKALPGLNLSMGYMNAGL